MPGIADVLLVTVNVHETQALLDAFQQATGKPAIAVKCQGRNYRNLGTLCNTRYFHVLSEMGSGGVGGMQQSVNRAINALRPDHPNVASSYAVLAGVLTLRGEDKMAADIKAEIQRIKRKTSEPVK